jgi:DNA-binding SARP family transcriptional activator
MDDGIALRLLGPVTLRAGQGWVSPRSSQLRLMLAVLALNARQVVPVPELIDAVWEERPPRSVRASLHALVTHARRSVAGIQGVSFDRCGNGYRLGLDPASVDIHRFRALAKAGRNAADGRLAIEYFDEALALWRGQALADVPCTATAEMLRSTFDEERLAVATDRIGRLLSSGREWEAIAEVPSLLAHYPLAEPLAEMLMVARYRCGQRAEALQAFRDIRGRLSAELGVEPGSDLQCLHQRILAGDPPTDVAPAGWRRADGPPTGSGHRSIPDIGQRRVSGLVPRQLPAAAAQFVARAAELELLDGLVTADGASPASVWVISGPQGVGKTALALHWAHGAARHFPDGQLYVNLMGFSPSDPMTPDQAIRGFLQAAGVAASEIPDSAAAQAALYRTVLAGRRMLVVLDNAADAGQVRPLLPGTPSCVVLITSRSQLAGLAAAEGARLLSLNVLAETDARDLLARRLGEKRVAVEPRAAAELARLCAGLPLALTIAAARAAASPNLRLSDVAAELRREPGRLDALELGAPGSVREVFSWSRRHLSDPAEQMFC